MWRAPSDSKYLYLKTRGDLHIPTMHTLFLRPPRRRTVLSKPQKSRSRSLVTAEVCYPCRSVRSSEIFGKLKSFYFQADWHQSYEIQRHLSDGKASPSIDRLWIQVAYWCQEVSSRVDSAAHTVLGHFYRLTGVESLPYRCIMLRSLFSIFA